MRLTSRCQGLLAATAFACLSLLGASEPSFAGPFGDEAARAVAREQVALSSAADSVGLVADSVRPMARTDADGGDITVASREAAPEDSGALSAASGATGGQLDFATLDAMPRATGDAQWQCLAQAIYFESRGEPLAGQIAVAEVVLNRAGSRQFPSTVCGVTHQGAGSGKGCQFSYVCDSNSDTMRNSLARDRSEKLARLMLDGRPRTVTGGATYFHVRSIRPDWSRRFNRTVTIGHHMFYRPATQVAGS